MVIMVANDHYWLVAGSAIQKLLVNQPTIPKYKEIVFFNHQPVFISGYRLYQTSGRFQPNPKINLWNGETPQVGMNGKT